MPETARDLIASLTRFGGETAAENHAQFAADLAALLALSPAQVPDRDAWLAALAHGFAYYFWRWDPRAVQHHTAVEQAIQRWAMAREPDLELLCELLDFLYFESWCFEASSIRQSELVRPGMQAAAVAFSRGARRLPRVPAPGAPIHVFWLAMYARHGDAMAVALRHVAPVLLAQPARFRLTVVAWRFAAPDFLDRLRGLGATCHVIAADTATGRIAAVEALAAADPPAIAITDMNNAVPTALYARRLAPAQILMQAGMPAWPVRPLDGVFTGFGFDPTIAGWGTARVMRFRPPWDLAAQNPPEDSQEVARERARLPQGFRLIGNYGRLVKQTEPCLRAVESILRRCPDVAFVTGGTGDASFIRDFIARSDVGARMQLVEGFVPGQSWSRFLEVFLDTWPQSGGESCREVLAKGRPVVALHSVEMPAFDRQRDPALLAADWPAYVEITVRLLQDKVAYAAACAGAEAVARAMADQTAFAGQLVTDLEAVLDDARARQAAESGGIWTAMRRMWHRRAAA